MRIHRNTPLRSAACVLHAIPLPTRARSIDKAVGLTVKIKTAGLRIGRPASASGGT